MNRLNRRGAIGGILGVGGSWLVGCSTSQEDARSDAASDGGAFVMPACEHDAIVESLLREKTDALPVLQKWLASGTKADALFAAALTVGARLAVTEDDFHTAMVVNGAYLMSKRVTGKQQLVPLFYVWNKQQRVAANNPGQEARALPPLDAAKIPAASDANARLLEALEAWDAPAAEAAIVALHAAGGREAVIGPLLRYALRNQHQLGHRAIWVVYAVRCMDALGWGCAPWVLRSLVRAINSNRHISSVAAFPLSLARVAEVPAAEGADDPTVVPAILAVLRVGDASACVDEVLKRLAAGASRRTIWTAFAIAAVELSVRAQESSVGVHELDAINALHHLSALTRDRDIAAAALLQGAAWHPEFRAELSGKTIRFPDNLDAVTPASGAPPTLAEAFAAVAANRIEGTRKLVSFLDAGGRVEEVVAAYTAMILERASGDEHHYKFNVALFEEIEAALPEYRKALILGITLRGPTSISPKWSRHDDTQAILASL
jgi:hypothetical protein